MNSLYVQPVTGRFANDRIANVLKSVLKLVEVSQPAF